MNDKLSKAASAVAEAQANVRTITENISSAEAIVAAASDRRTEHELAAALGNHESRNHLDQILRGDSEAERQLQMQQRALALALEQLKSAENAHRVAVSEIRRAEKNRLARERVAAADKIDAALAAFSSAWVEYEQLGRELYSASDDYPNQIYLAEQFDGLLRLAAALPHQPFFDLRHKHSFCRNRRRSIAHRFGSRVLAASSGRSGESRMNFKLLHEGSVRNWMMRRRSIRRVTETTAESSRRNNFLPRGEQLF